MDRRTIFVIGAGALLGSTISEAIVRSLAQAVEVLEVCQTFDNRYFMFVEDLMYLQRERNSGYGAGAAALPISLKRSEWTQAHSKGLCKLVQPFDL
jgi:hypothetical protein